MKRECTSPRCTGKADASGLCWRHRRTKPMARTPGPRRKVACKVVNRKRKRKTFARCYGSRERVAWLKAGGCEVYREAFARAGATMDTAPWPEWWRCDGPLDAMHVRARGMGGAKGDASDMVCGCRKHHDLAGELGTSQRAKFEARSGLDLVALADMRDREWRALAAAQEGRAEP